MPSISAIERVVFWIIAAIAGGFSAIVGNVLAINIVYFFTQKGRKPTRRPLRVWVIFLLSLGISIVLGALAAFAPAISEIPATITTPSEAKEMSLEQLMRSGAYVHILSVTPAPETTLFEFGSEVPVIVTVEYNLPNKTFQPSVQLMSLQYTAPSPSWNVIQNTIAQTGIHKLQLSGLLKVPQASALNGQPFQIAVEMTMLEEGIGDIRAIATDKVTLKTKPIKAVTTTPDNIQGAAFFSNAQNWPLTFFDSFDNNNAKWSEDVSDNTFVSISQSIKDGTYIWSTKANTNGGLRLTTAPAQTSGFVFVAVDARVVRYTGAVAYGVVFRCQTGSDQYYHIRLYLEKKSLEVKYRDKSTNAWETLALIPNIKVEATKWNRIAVIEMGADYWFYVDGIFIYHLKDERLRGGSVGLITTTENVGDEATVEFDNFEYRSITP